LRNLREIIIDAKSGFDKIISDLLFPVVFQINFQGKDPRGIDAPGYRSFENKNVYPIAKMYERCDDPNKCYLLWIISETLVILETISAKDIEVLQFSESPQIWIQGTFNVKSESALLGDNDNSNHIDNEQHIDNNELFEIDCQDNVFNKQFLIDENTGQFYTGPAEDLTEAVLKFNGISVTMEKVPGPVTNKRIYCNVCFRQNDLYTFFKCTGCCRIAFQDCAGDMENGICCYCYYARDIVEQLVDLVSKDYLLSLNEVSCNLKKYLHPSKFIDNSNPHYDYDKSGKKYKELHDKESLTVEDIDDRYCDVIY
jgi:hypothetical protein